MDPHDESCASSKASSFIKYDFVDHKKDEEHARNINIILKKKGLNIDGCVTFVDAYGPLAAIICNILGLHGPGQHAAEVAKNKWSTYDALRTKRNNDHNFPITGQYIVNCYNINNISDIDLAITYVGFPAVLKPETGSCGGGVKSIRDSRECKYLYQKMKPKHGNNFALMEFIDGTQHGVEIIIFQRKLIAAFVTDYGPTRADRFTETSATMPTCLPLNKEQQLITAAYQCCHGIDLVDGVFNVEMRMSPKGPKLIEINGRMPGYYIRDWVLACYGIDLLLYSFMTCLGIRPEITKPTPNFHILGMACVPSMHKEQLENSNILDSIMSMKERRIILYYQMRDTVGNCEEDEDEIPFCSLAVTESSLRNAKVKLKHVWDLVGLNTNDYDLNYFLKYFKH